MDNQLILKMSPMSHLTPSNVRSGIVPVVEKGGGGAAGSSAHSFPIFGGRHCSLLWSVVDHA